MPLPDPWDELGTELGRWSAEGKLACLWLRDDDAVEATAALERLLRLTSDFGVPVVLAVVPEGATSALARRLAGEPRICVAQHGFAHRNHAAAGEKAAELGGQRPLAAVLEELGRGRDRLAALFGTHLYPALVPPWNRIAPAIPARLPALGFTALSTFGWADFAPVSGLRQSNCHVDIIDWKRSRRAHAPAKLLGDLVEALGIARQRGGAPVGVLTHHLVHDEGAWAFLRDLFAATARHADTVRWRALPDLLAAGC